MTATSGVTAMMDRLATAPISWGVCEVPGWGHQLEVDRVLGEMVELGFTATELGSDGWLPAEPARLNATLAAYDLSLLAAFVPLVMHDPAQADDTRRRARETAKRLEQMGATYFNTAAVTSYDWGPRFELSDDQWAHVMAMFAEVEEIVTGQGLTHVLHTHVDTIIETNDDVRRCLDDSNISFVFDTAHLALGGVDLGDFLNNHFDRIGLVHIKDLERDLVAPLLDNEITLMQAVQAGIFPTVGQGDLDIESLIVELEHRGFDGWYVLEQDVAITGELPAKGQGPVQQVRESLEQLTQIQDRLAHSGTSA